MNLKRLTFNNSVPLNQDQDGTIRVNGSRVTLDTIVAVFKK